MQKIVAVKAMPGYKIWIKFEDGAEGVTDLSDMAGRGVFIKWKETGFFESVFIDQESHTVAWPGGLDLAPESLYEEITGKNPLREPVSAWPAPGKATAKTTAKSIRIIVYFPGQPKSSDALNTRTQCLAFFIFFLFIFNSRPFLFPITSSPLNGPIHYHRPALAL